MKTRTVRVLASAMLALPMLVASAAAEPQPVACGDVIDAPGSYELSGDLSCPLGVPPPLFCEAAAITITAPNVRLNGHGFTVSGIETGVAIRILATDVKIRDIVVERFNIGIEITGGGQHQLQGVTSRRNSATHCGDGVGLQMTNTNDNRLEGSAITANERWGARLVSSNRNRLKGNEIRDNRFRPGSLSGNVDLSGSEENLVADNDLSRGGLFGVRLQDSDRNAIRGNVLNETATPAGFGTSIAVHGSLDNSVQDNIIDRAPTALGPGYIGIQLSESATRNTVRGNQISHQNRNGIWVFSGTENLLKDNVALDNTPFDAADENSDCDANTWKDNQFGIVNQPACID